MIKRYILALSSVAIFIVSFFTSTLQLSTGCAEPVAYQEPIVELHIERPVKELVMQHTEQRNEYRYIQGCPLSAEIQEGIFDICEKRSVSFEFVMAVIERESRFKADAVGDGGDSVGLMQIQEKWHSELMAELGVTDLKDPLSNVEVGVAILQSYFMDGKEVYYVLMQYNGGAAYADRLTAAGKVSKYALEITERAIEYELQNGI